jgi:prolipoprotein diacylglyceryltransferase
MVSPNSYTVLVGLSVCIGLAFALWQTRAWDVLTQALVIGACALVLGRVGYVALHWNYFADHGNEILTLASPGTQEHAALCGGCVGYWLLVKRDSSIANSQLLIVLCLSLIGIAASLGCIPNGCAYGQEVFWQISGERSLAWLLAVDWPDAYGINNPRLPTQLFMAGWLLVVGLAMLRMRRGDKASHHLPTSSSPLLLWLVLFALGDFVIQFARADGRLIWGGLCAEQWADIVLGGFAAAGIVRMRLRD